MFPTNSLICDRILKYLTLNDILKLRLVCSSFKFMVDDYFKNQKSLNLCLLDDNFGFKDIPLIKTAFKFGNHLLINRRVIRENRCAQFTNIVTNFFPNIQELFLIGARYENTSIPPALISKWKNINKLILNFPYPYANHGDELFESLKNLESLETLVILDPYSDTYIRLEKHSFLNRVKNLFLPSSGYLKEVPENLNLTSLGFHKIPKEVPEFWFGKLKMIYFCFDFSNGFLEFLRNLARVNSHNLVCLAFFQCVSLFLFFILF